MSFLTKLYINTLNKSWRKNPRTFSLNDYYKLYKKYHQNHISDIKQLIFTPEETEKIIFSCKKNHLTINTAIVSSFISSFNKLNNLQVKTAVGINIRNDLTFNAEHFIGNYASCITFDYKWHNNLNFLENSNKISNLIQNKVYTPKLRLLLLNLFLTMDQTLIDSIYFSAFGDFDNKAAAKAAAIFYPKNSFPQIGTTNLGKSRLKTHYGNNTLNSISFIPPSSPANIMTIGAVTHNNKLNICIAYECSLITGEEVNSIASEAKKLLLNI